MTAFSTTYYVVQDFLGGGCSKYGKSANNFQRIVREASTDLPLCARRFFVFVCHDTIPAAKMRLLMVGTSPLTLGMANYRPRNLKDENLG